MQQKKRPKDMNQLAKFIVDSVVGENNKAPKVATKATSSAKSKEKKK